MRAYGKDGFISDAPGQQVRLIVQAGSLKKAAEIFDCTLYEMTSYGGQTWNEAELEALEPYPPGTVLWTDNRWAASNYKPTQESNS